MAGIGGIVGLAGDTEQEEGGGCRVRGGGGVFAFSTNAKECRCDGGRAAADQEGLKTTCWIVYLLNMENGKVFQSVTCPGWSDMHPVP